MTTPASPTSAATAGLLWSVVKLDLRLQWRYGFFYAAAFSIALWEVMVLLIPQQLRQPALPYIIFGDSVVIGFFFIAAAVFFEKGERTLFALLSTPVRFGHYLTGKLATLSLVSLVAGLILAAHGIATPGDTIGALALKAGALVTAIVLCTLLFLLGGLVTAAPFPSMTDWLMPSTLVIAILNLPLLSYTGVWDHPLLYLLPTQGSLLLLGSAFDQLSLTPWQIWYALTYQILWVAALIVLARKAFNRYIVAKEGSQ
jgi:fluoroquinolone transport system permease protein